VRCAVCGGRILCNAGSAALALAAGAPRCAASLCGWLTGWRGLPMHVQEKSSFNDEEDRKVRHVARGAENANRRIHAASIPSPAAHGLQAWHGDQ
jgi:hypothetical protein